MIHSFPVTSLLTFEIGFCRGTTCLSLIRNVCRWQDGFSVVLVSPFICPFLPCSCCSLSFFLSYFSPHAFPVYFFSTFSSVLHMSLQLPFTDSSAVQPTYLPESLNLELMHYINWKEGSPTPSCQLWVFSRSMLVLLAFSVGICLGFFFSEKLVWLVRLWFKRSWFKLLPSNYLTGLMP